MISRRGAATVALALTLVGCGGSADQLTGTTWVLEPWSIARLGIEVPAGTIVDVRFDGAELGGTAACNHYGGGYEAGRGSLDLGDLAVTQMACVDASLMTLESVYLEAFSKVESWKVQDVDGFTKLTLTGSGVELRYAAVTPDP